MVRHCPDVRNHPLNNSSICFLWRWHQTSTSTAKRGSPTYEFIEAPWETASPTAVVNSTVDSSVASGHFASVSSLLSEGLVCYFPFLDSVKDYSGLSSDGTPVGRISAVPNRDSYPNQAISLGADDYVLVDGCAGGRTVAIWMYFSQEDAEAPPYYMEGWWVLPIPCSDLSVVQSHRG